MENVRCCRKVNRLETVGGEKRQLVVVFLPLSEFKQSKHPFPSKTLAVSLLQANSFCVFKPFWREWV